MKKRAKEASAASGNWKDVAKYYDMLYKWKNYGAEASAVHEIIGHLRDKPATTMLDAGCRTGKHTQALADNYHITGLEENRHLLDIAKKNFPKIEFVGAPLHQFNLHQRFDAIVCLFGAVNTCRSSTQLTEAIKNFSDHLNPGGVLVLEPLFTTETFKPGIPHSMHIQHNDTHIHRTHVPRRKSTNSAVLDFHYMITTRDGVTSVRDMHELGLFSVEQYIDTCTKHGIKATYLEQGLAEGRGLIIGVKGKH